MLKRLKLWLIVGLLGAAAAVFTQTVHAAIDFTVVVDSTGNTGIYTSVALDADGIPVISYFNQSDNTLKLADCQTPACTEFETRTVPNTGSVTGYTSLELDASGHPVITYWRSGSLGLAVCDDLICAAPTVRVVDDAGIVGANNALELNSAGIRSSPMKARVFPTKSSWLFAVTQPVQAGPFVSWPVGLIHIRS
ncbi:MAG: hypothetical protein ACFB51_12510 [Anaerolineae bacterium]